MDANVFCEIGEIFLEQKNLLEAERYFKNSLAINPDHHRAIAKLGDIYTIEGRIDLAKRMYEKALSLDENNEEYIKNLKKLESQ